MVNVKEIQEKTMTNRATLNDADAKRLEELLDEHISRAAEEGRAEVNYTAAGIEPSVVARVVGAYSSSGFQVEYQEFGVALTIRW